jgi:group I intron endonuclease
MYSIYTITNRINDKQYVGITKNPEQRWKWHRCARRNYRDNDRPLYRAIAKYGISNFRFKIIKKARTLNLANALEIKMIKELDTFRNGYNATTGGDGSSGCPATPERKLKISLSKIGKPRSPETIEKMRTAATGRPCPEHVKAYFRKLYKNRYVSPETRIKLSRINKGRHWPLEMRKRISATLTGRKLPLKVRLKIGHANTGQKRSKEARKKMSIAATLREKSKRLLRH